MGKRSSNGGSISLLKRQKKAAKKSRETNTIRAVEAREVNVEAKLRSGRKFTANGEEPEWDIAPPSSLTHQLIMGSAVVVPFVGTIAAIVLAWQYGMMNWLYLSMFLGGWIITGLGITIGFHRLAAHRSFDTHPWIRAMWLTFGSLAVEGSPIVWCAVHRRHHELSDKPGDPHSPHLHGEGLINFLKGFWFAHTGWLFTGYWTHQDLKSYVPDLANVPWLVRLDKMYYLWVAATLAIPMAIGGLVMGTWTGALLGLLWGGLVRVFWTHHITWSINSVCHIWGSRDYDSHDESTNNFLCGLLGFGEGWHNNHHAFPASARHGLKWWQFDSSWLIIRTLQAFGMAWNVKLPTERQMELKKLKK